MLITRFYTSPWYDFVEWKTIKGTSYLSKEFCTRLMHALVMRSFFSTELNYFRRFWRHDARNKRCVASCNSAQKLMFHEMQLEGARIRYYLL